MRNFNSRQPIFVRSDLGRALAISLVLHAVLMLQTLSADSPPRSQRAVAPAGNSLEATLRGNMLALAANPSWTTSRATTTGLSAYPEAPKDPRPSHHSSPEASAGSTPTPPAEIGDSSRGSLAGQESISTASPAAATLPSNEDGLDANGLRQYRLSLAVASRRFKRYPRQALEQGWSGTAEVRVAVAATGVPQFAELLSSSGHAALDAAALDMINHAALHTVVPSSLRGRTFSVPLPVVFNIDSERSLNERPSR